MRRSKFIEGEFVYVLEYRDKKDEQPAERVVTYMDPGKGKVLPVFRGEDLADKFVSDQKFDASIKRVGLGELRELLILLAQTVLQTVAIDKGGPHDGQSPELRELIDELGE